MLRGLPLLFAILVVALVATPALADGKVFRRGVAQMPAIPDQQAIIAWDIATSIETLVIETRFSGSVSPPGSASPSAGGTSAVSAGSAAYAWVVPLPGPEAPEIAPATSGLFPTVREVFQPRVIDQRGSNSLWFTFTLTVALLAGVWLTTLQRSSPLVVALLVLVGFTCVGGLLLPTLGTGGSSGSRSSAGVDVLSRTLVGSYDIAVIGAADSTQQRVESGKAIADWLQANGFQLPAAAAPVLAHYAARSWVFAAIKLRPSEGAAGNGLLTPHPLIFKFKAAAPVYPMQLTGVGNGPLTLDLYVFGTQRAAAPGLTEVRCDRCRADRELQSQMNTSRGGIIAVVHPGLKGIVGALPFATKLSGTLSPEQQAADMVISWDEFRESGGVMHSPRAARWAGLELGAAIVPAVVLVLIIVGVVRKRTGSFVFRHLGWALAPAIITGVLTWAITPTVPIQEGSSRETSRREEMLSEMSDQIARELDNSGRSHSLAEAKALAAAIAKDARLETQEQDSPRRFCVREGSSPGSIEFVIFNALGAEYAEQVWPRVAKERRP